MGEKDDLWGKNGRKERKMPGGKGGVGREALLGRGNVRREMCFEEARKRMPVQHLTL